MVIRQKLNLLRLMRERMGLDELALVELALDVYGACEASARVLELARRLRARFGTSEPRKFVELLGRVVAR